MFIVNNLSQFLEHPSNKHWKAAKRVLKYLKGTISVGIEFSPSNCPNILTAYSDADYGSCVDSRKSISGVIIILNNGPIIWSSRKQSIVATSTTESEYVAAHEAAKEITWARGLLKQLDVEQAQPTLLYCDNAAKLIKNLVYHKRTKHIDIKFHFVRQIAKDGQLKIQHVSSTEQLADILTKPLTRDKFEINRKLINLV